MQREREAAISCAVRTFAWMADGYAMLGIASAMTAPGEPRRDDEAERIWRTAMNYRSSVSPRARYKRGRT